MTDVASIPTPSEQESDESPQDVRAEGAADAAVPTEASSGAAAAESDADAEFESTDKAVGGAPEPSESRAQPVSSSPSASPHQEPTEVPEWYAKATARARKEAEESLSCGVEGENIEIALNHQYVVDGLSSIPTDRDSSALPIS